MTGKRTREDDPPVGKERDRRPVEQAAEPEASPAYDVLVTRLEKIVGELEAGQLSLEQSIERFAEGVRTAREAQRKLDEAERRVEMLVRSAEGEPEAVPFDPDSKGPTVESGR
jgi:exodeoxyribonuclease VII small subunit